MATRYSKVQASIWSSNRFKILEDFTKLVYLYLLSCPHGNSAGLFRLPEGYAITDLGCTSSMYTVAIKELVDAKMVTFEDDVVLIKKFLKFNPFTNISHAKGNLKHVQDYIGMNIWSEFYKEVSTYCPQYIDEYSEPVESLSRACQEPVIKKKDKEKNKDTVTIPISPQRSRIIKLRLNDGTEYPITTEQVNKWSSLYPAVDVLKELRKMVGWLDANPKRRKTKSGILKFVTNWLSRAQDKGDIQASKSKEETEDDLTDRQKEMLAHMRGDGKDAVHQ